MKKDNTPDYAPYGEMIDPDEITSAPVNFRSELWRQVQVCVKSYSSAKIGEYSSLIELQNSINALEMLIINYHDDEFKTRWQELDQQEDSLSIAENVYGRQKLLKLMRKKMKLIMELLARNNEMPEKSITLMAE